MNDWQKFRRELMKEVNESCLVFLADSNHRGLQPEVSCKESTGSRQETQTIGALQPDMGATSKAVHSVKFNYFNALHERRTKVSQAVRKKTLVALTKHVWWIPDHIVQDYLKLHSAAASGFNNDVDKFLRENGPGVGQWAKGVEKFRQEVLKKNNKTRDTALLLPDDPALLSERMCESVAAWRDLQQKEPLTKPIIVRFESDERKYSFRTDFVALTLLVKALEACKSTNRELIDIYLREFGQKISQMFEISWSGLTERMLSSHQSQHERKRQEGHSDDYDPNYDDDDDDDDDDEANHITAHAAIQWYETNFRDKHGNVMWEAMLEYLRQAEKRPK